MSERQKKAKPTQKHNKQPGDAYKYSAMAVKMGAVIAGSAFTGRWLDNFIKIKFPVFTLLFVLMGVALAIYIVVKDTQN